ncbi:MAG: glycosyltransferase, partial [Actinomycetota bacterium]|nr:glycosyltransferase [Actinomycetota bacterium]
MTPPTAPTSQATAPTVTIVFLVYNRCAELRASLEQMTRASDYEPRLVDVIVVDNASTDGSAAMVRDQFPSVQLIVRNQNVGVSGWNQGLAAARGDYVLALDDDCYLPTDGLRRAVAAAAQSQADLVSFRVVSTHDPQYAFTEEYLTGLFAFWGCAVLMRRDVVQTLGGYDPYIFVWGNELEFMLRFFDRGFRHLHLPEVVAQHMKAPPDDSELGISERGYRLNARHWAYTAAKLLAPRDALDVLVAILGRAAIDGLRCDPVAFKAVPDAFAGLLGGLRHREPVRDRQLSRFYRRNFETFASPWWLLRPMGQLLRELPQEMLAGRLVKPETSGGRRDSYLRARSAFYPRRATVLEFSPEPRASAVELDEAQMGMPHSGN